MIEVKMPVTQAKKYYKSCNGKWHPVDINIMKYNKFLKKCWILRFNTNENNTRCFVDVNDDRYEIKDIDISDDEYFIFEFPDYYPEEDLFYFKMKYC